MKIVIDTSVIIEYLRTSKGLFLELSELARKKRASLYISSVVVLELWKGRSMEDTKVENEVGRLLQLMKVIPLSRQLAREAGTLMRKGKIDNFIDSSIAAITLYLDAQLATRNRKHFEKVHGLKFFKPQ